MKDSHSDWVIVIAICLVFPVVLPMTILAALVLSVSNAFKKEGGLTDEV
jgi:hypothetical protein